MNTASTRGRLRIVRAPERLPDVASGAMVREAAISRTLVGAERIWVGYVELPPGMSSAPHHHGECESAIYIISGVANFRTGEEYTTVEAAHPGDFVWVPPEVAHIEENASASEPVRMVVVRSTQETLVFNL
ncbi:MAG TPA: cupin domain-containing protein [Candidatus Dormibacteraeota bacterium]|nr:cupin domain-containing protein [Candidatus Dormibacteraeota bacterium]